MSKSQLKYFLKPSDCIPALSKYDPEGVLVDLSVKTGDMFFPKLIEIGEVGLIGYTKEYDRLIHNYRCDVKKIKVVLIDVSDSEEFIREYLPMSSEFRPNVPDYATKISDLIQQLSSFSDDTVILKKYDYESERFFSPDYIGTYNNESYPLVKKSGEPVTAGLNNTQTVCFSFTGIPFAFDGPIYYQIVK